MLRHLSEPAWNALEQARVEAARRGRTRVTPEHLLIALLYDRTARAPQALVRCGVDLDEALAGARSAAGPATEAALDGPPHYHPSLQLALERAACMAGDQLDTGALLKGVVRDRSNRASRVLEALGAAARDIDRAVGSVAPDEAEGPAIDESDPLFEAMSATAATGAALELDDAITDADVRIVDLDFEEYREFGIDGRLRAHRISMAPRTHEREAPPGTRRLLTYAAAANFVAVLVVPLGLLDYVRTNDLVPPGAGGGTKAVAWLALIALGIVTSGLLLTAGTRLFRFTDELQSIGVTRRARRRVPRWLALGIVGALVGGTPGFLHAYRTLERVWVADATAPLLRPFGDLLVPALPLVVIAINALAWALLLKRLHTATPARVG